MLVKFIKNRTSTVVVMYSFYPYFLGLSLRNTSKALVLFRDEKRSHIAIRNWIQFFVSMYNDTIFNKNEFIIKLQEEVNITLN